MGAGAEDFAQVAGEGADVGAFAAGDAYICAGQAQAAVVSDIDSATWICLLWKGHALPDPLPCEIIGVPKKWNISLG